VEASVFVVVTVTSPEGLRPGWQSRGDYDQGPMRLANVLKSL
jgi:hypothetical protein